MCDASEPVPGEAAMLTLELAMVEGRYAPQVPVLASLALGNTGPDAPVVKTRLAINSPLAPAAFRDVSFVVTGPAGVALPFEARVNAGLLKSKHFAGLAVGETVVREYAIESFCVLSQPGRYTLQALYQNQDDPPDGRVAWEGELWSNVVAFEIMSSGAGSRVGANGSREQ
jgi:hypothetical protein